MMSMSEYHGKGGTLACAIGNLPNDRTGARVPEHAMSRMLQPVWLALQVPVMG